MGTRYGTKWGGVFKRIKIAIVQCTTTDLCILGSFVATPRRFVNQVSNEYNVVHDCFFFCFFRVFVRLVFFSSLPLPKSTPSDGAPPC